MENKTKKTISITTYNKLKKENENLAKQLEASKTLSFCLMRLHRVGPEGLKLKKTKREIDEMSLQAINYAIDNISEETRNDYRQASLKVLINNLKR